MNEGQILYYSICLSFVQQPILRRLNKDLVDTPLARSPIKLCKPKSALQHLGLKIELTSPVLFSDGIPRKLEPNSNHIIVNLDFIAKLFISRSQQLFL